MKPTEVKLKFIELRAEGCSYDVIAKELSISKSTCTEWERELKAQIAETKREEVNALINSYAMTKEARIKKLGDTLNRIEEAIAKKNLEELPADKLLDYKIKYMEALKEEFILPTGIKFEEDTSPQAVLTALADLLERVQAGEVTAEQASKESSILSNILKAYDTIEVKDKLATLESILSSRA